MRALVAEGRIEMFGGLRGPYRSWQAPPTRLLEEWTVAGVRHRNGFDGTVAWEQDGEDTAPRILSGARRDWLVWRARCSLHLRDWPAGTNVEYDDRRPVDGMMLPHHIMTRSPDHEYTVRIDRYHHETPDVATYAYPVLEWNETPIALSLATLPTRIHKIPDGLLPGQVTRFWDIPHPPMERWLVHVLAHERYGRPLEPVEATITFYAGEREVKREVHSAASLCALQRAPASRFAPRGEIFHLRHRFTEPVASAVSRIRYTLTASSRGDPVAASLDIPVTVYEPRTRLRCPLNGPFLVSIGHEPQELSHTYEWSQQFACDLVPLDTRLAPLSLSDDPAPVLAPADGVVVRTRDDIPDDMEPSVYLGLDDPLYAIGGNGVVLNHGHNEYSMLFHLRHGSVRVHRHDRVRQGDVLGAVGSAGTPGYLHLHYHLQAGPDFLAADGLPVRFDNVVMASDWLGPYRRGIPVPVPIRGPYLETTPD
jgi:Peptidase family M23